MKRLRRGVLFAVPLLLLALPAGAGTGSSVGAKSLKARTLVVEKGPIYSFAQDRSAIAWIGPRYQVHVRSLSAELSSIVGDARQSGGPVRVIGRPLALAGTRALWMSYGGGNSPEASLWTSALGGSATWIDHYAGGIFLTGVAGDGPTLVYGKTFESCAGPPMPPGTPCRTLEWSGGVNIVTGQYEDRPISGIPPPVMLAFASPIPSARVAVVPAVPPASDLGPKAAENGPVEVYWLVTGSAHLMSRVAPMGTVRAIALNYYHLAVLVQRPDGTKAIERYNVDTGRLLQTTAVAKTTALDLGMSTSGIVFRNGSKIYLLEPGKQPKLVWKSSGTPIGLSIKVRRIAWAENVKGHGRIVALTLR